MRMHWNGYFHILPVGTLLAASIKRCKSVQDHWSSNFIWVSFRNKCIKMFNSALLIIAQTWYWPNGLPQGIDHWARQREQGKLYIKIQKCEEWLGLSDQKSQLLFSSYLIHLLSSQAERGGGSPAAERLREKQPNVLAGRGFHPSGASSVFPLIYQICNGQAFISLRDWAKTQGEQHCSSPNFLDAGENVHGPP